jgi:hypothetical protein
VTQTEQALVAEATGLGVAPSYAASETEFFVKVINVQLTFQRGPTGAVTGLVLHHGGKDIPREEAVAAPQVDFRVGAPPSAGGSARPRQQRTPPRR